jgi:meiotic recombination protein SPO11
MQTLDEMNMIVIHGCPESNKGRKKLIADISELLKTKTFKKKREIYYDNSDLFNSASACYGVLNTICKELSVLPYKLNVLPNNKCDLFGNIKIGKKGKIVDCDDGERLPHNFSDLTSIETGADYVVVVEKDTVYTKLLLQKDKIPSNCIVLTACGYPDVNTRLFLMKLNDLGLQIYLMTDADPHGIEIVLCYKYGSNSLKHFRGKLAIGTALWIG